jgi:hypothetical protein
MKKNILIMALSILLIGSVSCKKERDEKVTEQSSLEASMTSNVKRGEPVNFKLSQVPDTIAVQWSVTPSTEVKIIATGNTASVLFGTAGSYSVNAAYDSITANIQVSVQDSIYSQGSNDPFTNVPLTGDQIFITVSKFDSTALSGLNFRFITEKKYKCLNHTLMFDNIFSGQDLKIDFKSVFIPSDKFCATGEDFASSGTAWYPVSTGDHTFAVVLDGKTYTGSFIKTGSSYTFTWPYTSGVTISPLVIN